METLVGNINNVAGLITSLGERIKYSLHNSLPSDALIKTHHARGATWWHCVHDISARDAVWKREAARTSSKHVSTEILASLPPSLPLAASSINQANESRIIISLRSLRGLILASRGLILASPRFDVPAIGIIDNNRLRCDYKSIAMFCRGASSRRDRMPRIANNF